MSYDEHLRAISPPNIHKPEPAYLAGETFGHLGRAILCGVVSKYALERAVLCSIETTRDKLTALALGVTGVKIGEIALTELYDSAGFALRFYKTILSESSLPTKDS